jgi:tRNA splicing ligase
MLNVYVVVCDTHRTSGAATGAGKSRKAEQERALAEKLAKMSIKPQEFFRTGANAALYSQFDEDGVPTHDAAGEKVCP